MPGLELRAEPLRSLAYTGISSSYAPIGIPLSNPTRILLVQNLTNATLTFSYDGVNDHFVLPANGFKLTDITTNELPQAGGFFVSRGTQMSVKTNGTPSSGSVYVSAEYAGG